FARDWSSDVCSSDLRRAPDAGEVEVRVRVAALNFRDVMNVLGLYPGDPGPLGNECAGIVTRVGSGVDLRVGDEVVGLAAGSFARSVERRVWRERTAG